jgi:dolichyl-phosphate-mannose-protein mannosyltransferase
MIVDRPSVQGVNLRPGLIAAALFLCVYGTLALTVDFPRTAQGFKSDEATYYMMAYSLTEDGDLAYRKEDLVRVWREFPGGPSGVFLQKGRTLQGTPDPDPNRFYYGKSFIYPLFAAPFVKVFGTNGFLVLHALLLAMVLLCGYLFLHARSGSLVAAVLASGFVMASVVPVYFVWLMPEVFNFSLVFLAYFCWLYKEVARHEHARRGTKWLFCGRSDVAAAVLLGIATFSKITNAFLFAPILVWQVWSFFQQRSIRAAKIAASALAFVLVAGGLFGINKVISGEWNYQGGDRDTYYVEFPLQNEATKHELGQEKSRKDLLSDVIFSPRTFTSNLTHNLEYFFIGRYTGLVGYFFPAVFGMCAFLLAPRQRPGWQWLVLASGLLQGLVFLILTPYTWHGGGVGNRYFFSGYGVMLFVLPPIQSLGASFAPWAIGGLFVAPMVLNPFVASFHPAGNAKSGLLRLLPVELTLVNDLPVNNEPQHARLWFGDTGQGDPGFLVYFLDDNAFDRDADKSFWTRGGARAEFIIKTDRPIVRAKFTVTAGPVATDAHVNIGGRRQDVHLEAGASRDIVFAMPPGLPYEKEVQALAWTASVSSSNGFTPIFFDPSSTDTRYLGVRVKPVLEAGAR